MISAIGHIAPISHLILVTMGRTRRWGPWTEIKLDAIEKYVSAFAVASQSARVTLYLDLFAGRPENEALDERVFAGSALRAAMVDPPFTKILVSDIDAVAAAELQETLRSAAGDRAEVIPGDCNLVIPQALNRLPPEFRWAPAFALIDQFSAEVRWETVAALACFKDERARTKVELMMYFGGSFMVRGLFGPGGRPNVGYAKRLDLLYGNQRWREILAAKEDGAIDASQVQHELVNLMRWQLEHDLSYGTTLPLQVVNTRGRGIFSMIFATDHPVGDRIMRHLFEGADEAFEDMVRQRKIDAKVAREAASGQGALFEADPSHWAFDSNVLHAPIAAPEPPFGWDRIWDHDLQ